MPTHTESIMNARTSIEPGVSAWRALDDAMRARIESFLTPAAEVLGNAPFSPEGPLPPDFARDLATGGHALRAAFPALARRVVGVTREGETIAVRVRCEGDHDGPFFRILSPTGRRVSFDVTHHLVVRDGVVVVHRVAIDVRAIVVRIALSEKRDARVSAAAA
jgi:ketosteroid isomerase-like protein